MNFYFSLCITFTLILSVSLMTSFIVLPIASLRNQSKVVQLFIGYLINTLLMGSFFKFVSIQTAWIITGALFGIYLLLIPRYEWKIRFNFIFSNCRKYAIVVLFMFIGCNIFLLPLHIKGEYGPFTEGGGDISIYADGAKYLADEGLPAFGINDVVFDLKNFATVLHLDPSIDNTDSTASFDPTLGNPPVAEYATYRIVKSQYWTPWVFVTLSQWNWITPNNNYPVFYAQLAFFYSILLCLSWTYFARFSIAGAALSTLFLLSSHGIISIHYNQYYIQAICLSLSMLALVLTIENYRFSMQAPLYYFLCLFIPIVSYPHYLTLLFPLLFIGMNSCYSNSGSLNRFRKMFSHPKEHIFFYFIATCATWTILIVFIDFLNVFKLYSSKLMGVFAPDMNKYLGNSISVFSVQWTSYFLGIVSQQHFPPFITANLAYYAQLSAGAFIGAASIALSLFYMLFTLAFNKNHFHKMNNPANHALHLILLYFFSLLFILINLAIIQKTNYMQAKGAQNALPLMYSILLCVPYSLAINLHNYSTISKYLFRILTLFLSLFMFLLFIIRIQFVFDIAFESERSSIINDSYFRSANHILRNDNNALTIFEPRKSSDIYLTIQPFFKHLMISSKHLALTTIMDSQSTGHKLAMTNVKKWDPRTEMTAQLSDHLWLLYPKLTSNDSALWGQHQRTEWKTLQLSTANKPTLLFFANDYIRMFMPNLISEDPQDAIYSYIRNGSCFLYSPRSLENKRLSITIKSMRPEDSALLFDLLENDKNHSWIENDRIEYNAQSAIITKAIHQSNTPLLMPIINIDYEYLIQIKLDGTVINPSIEG